MQTNRLQTQMAGVRILQNGSRMPDTQVCHKARDYSFEPGYHLVLAQDRYGNGVFFMDWKRVDAPPETLSPDWNIIVEVQ